MVWRRLLALVAAVVVIALSWSGVADHPATGRGGSAAVAFRELQWHELIPSEWDPTKRFRSLNLETLRDGDPQTEQLLLDMRATWDNAPTIAALNGEAVRLAGYVVPLEGTSAGLKEFLLVPYFGACVHSPPPPANQIVHVIADRAAAGLQTMERVSVSGTLKTARQASAMGVSGYRLSATDVRRQPGPR